MPMQKRKKVSEKREFIENVMWKHLIFSPEWQ
jgi:hypothetical protein